MRRAVLLSVALTPACQALFPLDNGTARDAASDSPPSDVAASPNVVFVSSIPVSADRGVAGADATCRELASAAGLSGEFVAWLSDSTTSAIDRLVGSRGWVRTDGAPVADQLDELLSRGPRVPIALSERGTSFAGVSPARVRTGTTLAGPSLVNCNDWSTTEPTVFGLSGELVDGGQHFTELVEHTCAEAQRVLCFERGKQAEVPLTALTQPIVFVTSASWSPNTGFGGADALCASEASGPLPDRSFRAVLTDEGQLEGRFPGQASTVFARPDGVVVGAILTPAAPLATFINVTASGGINFADRVWTGSNRGLPSNMQACGNWSNAGAVGVAGAPFSSIDAFDFSILSCNVPHPIYCAEVP